MFRIPVPPGDADQLESRYREFAVKMEEPLMETQNLIEKKLLEGDLSPNVRFRIKQFPSLYQKILQRLRSHSDPAAEELVLTDILGIRVVCPFIEDVNQAVAIIKKHFDVTEEERKGRDLPDYDFGYNSTHLLLSLPDSIRRKHRIAEEIICEVQIRTILQEAWAEVEHEIIYKTDFTPHGEHLRKKLAALNATLTLSDITFQEIRDYQRGLQKELTKRRNAFQNEVQEKTGAPAYFDSENQPPISDAAADEYLPGASDSVDNLLLKALKEHNAGHFDSAETIYSKILERVDTGRVRSIILIHRGMAAFARRAYSAALDDFLQASGADSSNARAWFYHGIVNRVLDHAELALSDFSRCLEIDPYQTDPLIARAQLLYRNGDLPGALTDCRNALELDSSLAEAARLHNLVVEELYRKTPSPEDEIRDRN